MVVTEVTSLKEGDGHVTEVVTLMEAERSSEGQRWSLVSLMEGK